MFATPYLELTVQTYILMPVNIVVITICPKLYRNIVSHAGSHSVNFWNFSLRMNFGSPKHAFRNFWGDPDGPGDIAGWFTVMNDKPSQRKF